MNYLTVNIFFALQNLKYRFLQESMKEEVVDDTVLKVCNNAGALIINEPKIYNVYYSFF